MLIAMEESSNYECSESHQSGGFFAVTKERRALMYAKLDKLREDLKKAVAKREAADAKVKQLEAKLKEEENQQIVRQTDRCKSMLVAKGAEYAPRAVKNTAVDRLAHFKKAAVVLNTTPRAALMGMLSKHLISVSDMCMGEQQYSKEQWDEKITDSINYFLILCAIVEEELNEEN